MTVPFPLTSLADLLGALFEQLREGVLLFDVQGHVFVANGSAARKLGEASLDTVTIDDLFAAPCFARACVFVRNSPDRTMDFLCPGQEGDRLFDCRLSWYGQEAVDSPFLLLVFNEAMIAETSLQSESRQCDSVGKLRRPLANLKAASENLLAHPDMSPVMRSAFENVIAQESVSLARTFDDLSGLCSESLAGRYNLEPCGPGELVGKALALSGCPFDPPGPGPEVFCTQEVLADHRWLQLLLASLCDLLMENGIDLAEIRFSPEAEGRFIYLDLLWQGQPLKAADIEEWQGKPVSRVSGSPSGADILRGHGSDLWSQEAGKPGFALIRLPLSVVPERNGNG